MITVSAMCALASLLIFLRTLFLSYAFVFFHGKSTIYGDTYLAVNIILLQFLNWMSYGIDGFAYAAESLVGKYYGADNEVRLRKTIRYIFVWGAFLALGFSLTYFNRGERLFGFFTDQDGLWTEATQYIWWMIILPIAGFACYLWDGIYIGMTASKAMRNTMFVSFVMYLGCYFLFEPILAEHAIWMALVVFLTFRGLTQTYLFYRKGTALK